MQNNLNWGAEKLRDDITCLALDLKNTELINQLRKKARNTEENKNKLNPNWFIKFFFYLF